MIFAANFTWDVSPADRRRHLQRRRLRTARRRLRPHPRRHRPVPLRLRLHLHARRLPGVHVRRSASGVPFWLVGGARRARSPAVVGVAHRAVRLPAARRATPAPTALLAIFVASLGIGIAGENLIRLLLGLRDADRTRARRRCARRSVGTAIFLNFDVWQVRQRRRHRRSASPRCCASPPSAGRSRPPGSTPRWPGSSASTPNQIYLIVLLHRHPAAAASPPSGTG